MIGARSFSLLSAGIDTKLVQHPLEAFGDLCPPPKIFLPFPHRKPMSLAKDPTTKIRLALVQVRSVDAQSLSDFTSSSMS